MLKVILADDENKIRTALKKLINWKDLNLELACECRDGDELLHQAAKMRPAIIITDMRMPGLNGDELIRALYEQDQHTKLLVLSGFDEFKFVRQALKAKAVDYLLKPVNGQEINAALKHASEQYIKEHLNLEKKKIHEQETYMEYFLRGAKDDRETFIAKSGLNADEKDRFCVANCWIYGEDGIACRDKTELFSELISAEIEKYSQLHGCVYTRGRHEGSIILLLAYNEIIDQKIWTNIIEQGKKVCNAQIYITVGNSYQEHLRIQDSYREAIAAFYALPISFKNGVSFYSDMTDNHIMPSEYAQEEYLLQVAAESGNAQQFTEEVEKLYTKFGQKKDITIAYLEQCNNRMLERIGCFSLEKDADGNRLVAEYHDELIGIINSETSKRILLKYLYEIAPCMENRSSAKKETAYKIRDYIQQHYCEKISLQSLTEEFFLTKEYISKIFKQEFSISISDYVDVLRIEKAKVLLKHGYTVREVTEAVGYYDESHLNRKFKKYTGTMPGAYRN